MLCGAVAHSRIPLHPANIREVYEGDNQTPNKP